MLKFNLTGSVQDELEKIAIDKGWVKTSGFAELKKEQTMGLQKLLNKELSGNVNSPLKIDGIWGPLTAGAYSQVMDKVPELEVLYTNVEPTNRQILDAFKILFKKQQEVNINQTSKTIKNTVEGLNIPESKVPFGLTDVPVAQKQNEQINAKKELEDEKIKYLMGQGLTEAEARSRVELGSQSADDPGVKNESAMELASQGIPVEEALKGVASNTISCLISLADELDSLGEAKIAIAIDNQINFYKKAMDKLYDVMGETGEDFINSAHTDHVTIAPAKDEGGKVENVVEQQKRDLEIATKDPTGKYARTILELVATANKLEEEGLTEAAERVDIAIAELQNKFPFANKKLASEAASFLGKKYASDVVGGDKIIWDNFWKEVEKNSKNLFSSITLLLTQCSSSVQGKKFANLLVELRRSIFNKEGGLVKKVEDKSKEISSFVKQNITEIGIEISDYVSFFNKLNAFYNFLKLLFAETEEKTKSVKSTQISEEDPYELEKNKKTEDNKKNLMWTITKLINVIDDEGNRKKLYQSVKPELVSGLRKYLIHQYNGIESLTLDDLNLKSKILWEVYKELQKQGLSVSEELSKQFGKTSSYKLTNKLAEDSSKLEQLITQLVGGKGAPNVQKKSPLSKRQGPGGGYNKNLPSDEVQKLQKALSIKMDGKYGPITHDALKSRLSQMGSNVSVPVNYSDVAMGNLEQVGEELRRAGAFYSGTASPNATNQTSGGQGTQPQGTQISKRTPAPQEDIKDPWAEEGGAQGQAGVEGQQQAGVAQSKQEQLKKSILNYLRKYTQLNHEYERKFFHNLGTFKQRFPVNTRQELNDRLESWRRLEAFLEKNGNVISKSYDVDINEMYENLESIGHLLGMREDEANERGL